VPHFNGLATVNAMKEKKDFFLVTSAKGSKKKRNLKYLNILGPYFTWFTLTEILMHVTVG